MTRLVELAVAHDEPEPLIDAAAHALDRPLALADRFGTVLARAPEGEQGEQAASVARAASRASLRAPPGWAVVALARERLTLGVLAIGDDGPGGNETAEVLRLLPVLLVDQLRRRSLVRMQRGALARRLVSTPPPPPHAARQEAAEAGIALAAAYWLAVLGWRRGRLTTGDAALVERAAARAGISVLAVRLEDEIVLLHPALPGTEAADAAAWFERAVQDARALVPASAAQAVAADEPVGLGQLGLETAHLVRISRLGPHGQGARAVTWSHEHALDDLLAGGVDSTASRQFVDAYVGPVLAWDREHGCDLLSVLEAGLDESRQSVAAARCFMHRNTFRHRLAKASELLGRRLDEPEGRLAVRLAIKLHRRRASVGR